MKKIIFSLLCSYGFSLHAQINSANQNNPGTTVLNSTSNNSMSGVNPNGNPGTILYNNSNSAAVNNTLITPNTPVTTTVISTPNNTPVVSRETPVIPAANANSVIVTTTAVDPNKSSNTAVETKIENAGGTKAVNAAIENKNINTPTTIVKMSGNTNSSLKPLSMSPVLVNYIPAIIVTKLKETYADKLYDITMMKKSDNQVLYIVRIKEGAGYITYHLDKDGSLIK